MTISRKELKGNIAISISDNEVRLWVCDDDGVNILRVKALGKVHVSESKDNEFDMPDQCDITIIGSIAQ